ncbi:hypothetical protein [Aquitalea sp.]|uniref:hypothetical protein n=1 Tax=Aquitalea sp. TaxID=1872623 RepID=UPI002589511E|nr:hypothetical protein [Aquitalea sp.]
MTFKLLLSLICSSLLARQLGSNPLATIGTLSLPAVLLLMTMGNAATYLLVRLLFIRLSPQH